MVGSAWEADVVLTIHPPDRNQLSQLTSGAWLMGLLRPLDEPLAMQALANTGVTALAFETLPRTTRAQSMDALSSQATLAGYEMVLEAASRLPRIFPMMMTAAGTLRPAAVVVLGCGVAGLQAIATARRLGAVVKDYDVRMSAAEQVRSLGGFVHRPGSGAAGLLHFGRLRPPSHERRPWPASERSRAAPRVRRCGHNGRRRAGKARPYPHQRRSRVRDLFGGFGGNGERSAATGADTPVRRATVEDVAVTLAYARSVIVVPGYGLAVAQAQYAARELADR